MRIHVPQFCRGTMNCALPVLLSFVSPGHDASCPYIYHFCKTCPRSPIRACPRSPIRSRTGSDRGTRINRHFVIPTKVGIHPHINYPIDFYKYYISLFLILQLLGFLPVLIAKLVKNIPGLHQAFVFYYRQFLNYLIQYIC